MFLPSGEPFDGHVLSQETTSIVVFAVVKTLFSFGSVVCTEVQHPSAFHEEDAQPGRKRMIPFHVVCGGMEGV